MLWLLFVTLSAFGAADKKENKITWLGQAATLIETQNNQRILIDPFIFNNPKTPAKFKKEDLYKNIDLILVTHGHGDHLGAYEKILNLSPKAIITMNADLAKVLITNKKIKEKSYVPLNKSGKFNPFNDSLEVNMVKAEHSSSVKIGKEIHYGGEPVGFILKFANNKVFYHTGDTGVFGDMKMIKSYYKPDLVFLPIGGNYTMGPKEAAYATNLLKPSKVVPIHYGTFPVLKGTPKEFKRFLKSKSKLQVLKPGESVVL